MPPDRKPSAAVLMLKLALLACVLAVLVLGAPPLLRALLHATGLSPLPPLAPATVTLRLVGSAPGDAWHLLPQQTTLQVQPGQFIQLAYDIRNDSPYFAAMQALPRYEPAVAATHIKKLTCFCFAEQRFAPGQTRRFPVVIVLDKNLPASVRQITLSYQIQALPA